MAISKLNLDWKNKGETGYEDSKMNKAKMGDITDKIDEIIDSENTFDTHNFGTSSGYQKFPSGLMMQWGSLEVTMNSTEISRTITFPQAFANNCINAIACISDPGQGSTTMTSNVGVKSFSKTTLDVRLKSTSNYADGQNVTIRWLVLGY